MVNKQPFRQNSYAARFCSIANVDWDTGYSDDVPKDKLVGFGFPFGNGGSWCRSDGSLGKVFNITRTIEHGQIVYIRLDGFNKSIQSTGTTGFIRKIFKGSKCAVLCVGGNNIEIDHKDGRKNDLRVDIHPDSSDFQPLHKTVNIAKRGHCKNCVATGIRFDAKQLGYSCSYWIGDHIYRGSCIGCYWYDPPTFNKKVSKCYKMSK